MQISEIFYSIQGESTWQGLPCIFIRTFGCNLSCDYCDTVYAVKGHFKEMTVDHIIDSIEEFDCRLVEITGGEPLLEPDLTDLINNLIKESYVILLETNGSYSLKNIPRKVIKIIDVKTPGSGHSDSFKIDNLQYINPDDQLKFVITDKTDYEFSKNFITFHKEIQNTEIIFSPVAEMLDPKQLAEWILMDGLMVRLQLQLHKILNIN